MAKPFIVDIACLDFLPTNADRKIKIWREMIRAKIKVPPIRVRAKPEAPGRYSVRDAPFVVEAARLENQTHIEVVLL